jgi:hypothetical protein
VNFTVKCSYTPSKAAQANNANPTQASAQQPAAPQQGTPQQPAQGGGQLSVAQK